MKYLFAYTGIHLCVNCENQVHCLFSSDKDTTQCEEYAISSTEKPTTPFIEETKSVSIPDYKGICTTCDYVENCSLRQDDSIILSCEHYK